MSEYYIGYIVCDEGRDEHLVKHELNIDNVRDAVQSPNRAHSVSWLDDPNDERGPRLLARGFTRNNTLIGVILYEIDAEDGTWRLCTAFPL